MFSEEKKFKKEKSMYVSWIVFLCTLSVVVLSLISILFPAFLLGFTTDIKYPEKINLFETGIWALPFLVTNFIIFGLAALYFKNKLPIQIVKSIKFIFNFEVSAKISFIVILILLGIYITLSVDELFMEEPWEDFERIKPTLEKWKIDDATKQVDFHLIVNLFANISIQVFGSYRVIPFLASIVLLILTYAITSRIAKKRFAGLVSMGVVLQSNNFLTFDTLITYSNFWTVFYILSLYLMYTKWYISPISFVLSTISKPLSILFLPMSLFFMYRANISKQKKIRILASYGIIVLLGFSILYITDTGLFNVRYDYHEFVSGFGSFASQFRFDGLIILFLLPLVAGLFISSRRGNIQADSILFLIFGMLLLAPIISGFTTYTNSPYRFLPLVIFFAMGVGTLLSKDYSTKVSQKLSNKSQKEG